MLRIHSISFPYVFSRPFLTLSTLFFLSYYITWYLHTKNTQTARLFNKINTKIDLDSPKVATMDKIKEGEKKVYCRCWLSGTFPLCDATHVAHNKETGDNVGPLIVSVDKDE